MPVNKDPAKIAYQDPFQICPLGVMEVPQEEVAGDGTWFPECNQSSAGGAGNGMSCRVPLEPC